MGKALVLKNTNFSNDKLTAVAFIDPVLCTGISLNLSELTFEETGASQTLIASVTPSDCTEQIIWASSNTSVVTVNNGAVTAIGSGNATITATCGQYSASCSVVVTTVPLFVAVSGYAPYRRSADSSAARSGKTTVDAYAIIAANKSSGLYPIESNSSIDTSPYRFVPIKLPSGCTQIKISCTVGNIRTRPLYFDSSKIETITNIGAFCVSGSAEAYDQTSSVPEVTLTIPTGIAGLDSWCCAIALGGGRIFAENNVNYADTFSIEYL